jgi:hypothetical protein
VSTTEWKLVPVEPTEEMEAAFGWPVDWARHYRAMLAASPAEPALEGGDSSEEARSRTAADDVAGLIEEAKQIASQVGRAVGAIYGTDSPHAWQPIYAALSRLQAREKDLSDALVGAREERDQCKRDAEAADASAATMREALTAARPYIENLMGFSTSHVPAALLEAKAKIDAALGGQHG